jgi:hypothetical protein
MGVDFHAYAIRSGTFAEHRGTLALFALTTLGEVEVDRDDAELSQHTVNDYVDSAFDGDPDQETLRGCLHALVAAREAPMEILELGNVWLALKERFKSAAGDAGGALRLCFEGGEACGAELDAIHGAPLGRLVDALAKVEVEDAFAEPLERLSAFYARAAAEGWVVLRMVA